MSLPQESQLVPYDTTPLPCDGGPWLVVAPHPDDESIGMGGTLAKAARNGVKTHVVVLTDGALGGNRDNLVQLRQQEVKSACALLGVAGLHFFDQPDRGLHVDAQLCQRLAALIDEIGPAAVFFPGVLEFHPDHRAAALLGWQTLQAKGQAAPQAIAYEISCQSPVNCLVDVTADYMTKQQAIAVYASQLGERPYLELAQALNKLRTLTLSPSVQWAEGFYCYSRQELALPLNEWSAQRMRVMLDA